MAHTPGNKVQKTVPHERPSARKETSDISSKRVSRGSRPRGEQRVNGDIEIVDLTNSDIEDVIFQFRNKPERPVNASRASSPRNRSQTFEDMVKVKKEHYGSRLDLSQVPEYSSESEEEEVPSQSRLSRGKAKKLDPKRSSKSRGGSSFRIVECIDLVGDNSDEYIQDSPLVQKAIRIANKASNSVDKDNTVVQAAQADDSIVSKQGAVQHGAASANRKPSKGKRPEPSHAPSPNSPAERKDSVLTMTPVSSSHRSENTGRVKRKIDNDTTKKLKSSGSDQDHQGAARSVRETDGASDQKDCLSMPLAYYPAEFKDMLAKRQSEYSTMHSKHTAIAKQNANISASKDLPSSNVSTPKKRKYAHFNDNPVDGGIVTPMSKKQRWRKRRSKTPSPTPLLSLLPEVDNDDLSSEDEALPDHIPKVKVSTEETYPGARSESNPQQKRSTPARAALEPLVPIPEKSKALARSKRERSAPANTTSAPASTKTGAISITGGNERTLKSSTRTSLAPANPKRKILSNSGSSPALPIVIDDSSEVDSSADDTDNSNGPDPNSRKSQPPKSQGKVSPLVRDHTLQEARANSPETPKKPRSRKTNSARMKNIVKCEEPEDFLFGSSKPHHAPAPLEAGRQTTPSQTPQKRKVRDAEPNVDRRVTKSQPETRFPLTPPSSYEAGAPGSKAVKLVDMGSKDPVRKKSTSSVAGFRVEERESSKRRQNSLPLSLADQAMCSGALSPVDEQTLKAKKKERKKAKLQRHAERLSQKNTEEQENIDPKHKEKHQSAISTRKKSTKRKKRTMEEIAAASADDNAPSSRPAIPRPLSNPVPWWSHDETIRLNQDIHVFVTYLFEMTEMAQRMAQHMAKIPQAQIASVEKAARCDIAFMNQVIDRAASEGQMEGRRRSMANWARLGLFLTGVVGGWERGEWV